MIHLQTDKDKRNFVWKRFLKIIKRTGLQLINSAQKVVVEMDRVRNVNAVQEVFILIRQFINKEINKNEEKAEKNTEKDTETLE